MCILKELLIGICLFVNFFVCTEPVGLWYLLEHSLPVTTDMQTNNSVSVSADICVCRVCDASLCDATEVPRWWGLEIWDGFLEVVAECWVNRVGRKGNSHLSGLLMQCSATEQAKSSQ